MAKLEEKPTNFSILSEIFAEQGVANPENKKIIEKIKEYFSDPKKADNWLAGAVLFFGIFGIIFGFSHLKAQLKSPFSWANPKSQIGLGQPLPTSSPDLLGLRQKDTDQDGLSDYDELYLYQTSPYLEDSDSDGVSDQQEIARNSDPNCPAGETCINWQQATSSEFFSELKPQQNELLQSFLSGQLNADDLRQLLADSGVDQQIFSGMTDEELITFYQTFLRQGVSQTSSENSANTQVSLSASQIQDLTPEQIRTLLQQSGVPAEVLEQLTDEELMKFIAETLKEY